MTIVTIVTQVDTTPLRLTMCIRCGQGEAPGPLGYCPTCALNARLELVDGLKQLGAYLTAWAAFEEWLRTRGHGEQTA
jgi:hypothetical protein